ncbi:hypothetical protein B0I35DRAFT_515408 [Stachybotrys elegans]|uniref:Uncharacterized protein n=1 Tax=Stachybotrys elegans TaxID=80388 RepID=A0A8K0SGZ8_9HYPO|nr:hypothetical protein B0I35DRAFT_515408 [Stachybotrys elegans]
MMEEGSAYASQEGDSTDNRETLECTGLTTNQVNSIKDPDHASTHVDFGATLESKKTVAGEELDLELLQNDAAAATYWPRHVLPWGKYLVVVVGANQIKPASRPAFIRNLAKAAERRGFIFSFIPTAVCLGMPLTHQDDVQAKSRVHPDGQKASRVNVIYSFGARGSLGHALVEKIEKNTDLFNALQSMNKRSWRGPTGYSRSSS